MWNIAAGSRPGDPAADVGAGGVGVHRCGVCGFIRHRRHARALDSRCHRPRRAVPRRAGVQPEPHHPGEQRAGSVVPSVQPRRDVLPPPDPGAGHLVAQAAQSSLGPVPVRQGAVAWVLVFTEVAAAPTCPFGTTGQPVPSGVGSGSNAVIMDARTGAAAIYSGGSPGCGGLSTPTISAAGRYWSVPWTPAPDGQLARVTVPACGVLAGRPGQRGALPGRRNTPRRPILRSVEDCCQRRSRPCLQHARHARPDRSTLR